jgi:RimJ/RimL family protein N-acetyltransferase
MTIRVETARLTLVPLDARFLDEVLRMHHEPAVARWLFLETPPTREQQGERLAQNEVLWAERGYGLFAALDKRTDGFLGRVGALVTPETGRIEIAWTMIPAVHGRGYATEAARAAIDFTWAHANLETLDCYLRPDNTASRRVAEKVGFRFKDMRWLYDRVLRFYQLARP